MKARLSTLQYWMVKARRKRTLAVLPQVDLTLVSGDNHKYR